MTIVRSPIARCIPTVFICWVSVAQVMAAGTQKGLAVPDRFRHAEQFVRALEGGGVLVYDIKQSTLEASFGGGQNAASIITNIGVVEIIVLPEASDAEQLRITYTKWDGSSPKASPRGQSPELQSPF